jgi:hypothetical protein
MQEEVRQRAGEVAKEEDRRAIGSHQSDGFAALFNRRNLDGGIGNLTGYRVENGVMTFDPNAGDRSNIYRFTRARVTSMAASISRTASALPLERASDSADSNAARASGHRLARA